MRTASVIRESGEALHFVHAHLLQLLQLASSTSAVLAEVQENSFIKECITIAAFPLICSVVVSYTGELNRKASQIPSSDL